MSVRWSEAKEAPATEQPKLLRFAGPLSGLTWPSEPCRSLRGVTSGPPASPLPTISAVACPPGFGLRTPWRLGVITVAAFTIGRAAVWVSAEARTEPRPARMLIVSRTNLRRAARAALGHDLQTLRRLLARSGAWYSRDAFDLLSLCKPYLRARPPPGRAQLLSAPKRSRSREPHASRTCGYRRGWWIAVWL